MHTKTTAARKTAAGRTLRDMDPDTIYFTHARIRPFFTGCNKAIQETLDEITSGQTKIEDIPYITVIENFEEAAEPGGKERERERERKKGGKRRGDSDSEDERRKKKTSTPRSDVPAEPFYFSLNNRRLYLFKTLKAMGVIDTISVQVKPALERERAKYTRGRCVLQAKIMGAQKREGEDEEDGMDVDGDEARE